MLSRTHRPQAQTKLFITSNLAWVDAHWWRDEIGKGMQTFLLRAQFWHRRVDVLQRCENYLLRRTRCRTRLPSVTRLWDNVSELMVTKLGPKN
eukprot:3940430-Amphidinium_carterae.1